MREMIQKFARNITFYVDKVKFGCYNSKYKDKSTGVFLREIYKGACNMATGELVAMTYPVMCYEQSTVPGIQGDGDVPFHCHDGYEFFLFLGGTINFAVGDSVFSPVRGELFIVSPEQSHRGISRGVQPYERYIISIRKDKIRQYMTDDMNFSDCLGGDDPNEIKRLRLSPDAVDEYCAIADKLSAAVYLRKPGDDLLVNAYITEILVLISRQIEGSRDNEEQGEVPELVTEVKNYIFEHLTEQIALVDLSKQFYFNGKYISAIFKKYTGMTLRAYILDQRITLAKRLLREGSNVSEACYHSGFLDYTNFIRSFTRTVGMSPGKYSRCARAGALGKF